MAVGAAAVGGWWFLLRGPSGAKAVADDYLSAVADNDWEAAADLYHEDSTAIRSIEGDEDEMGFGMEPVDDYEEYLEEVEGSLEHLQDMEPSVEDIYVYNHVPDLDEEAVEELNIDIDPEDAENFDEWKFVFAVVSDDTDAIVDEEEEEYLTEETKSTFSFQVLSQDGDWYLWSRFIA